MAFNSHPLLLRIRTAYLRFPMDASSRRLSSIAAQRANDFEAERVLHRHLCGVRAMLHQLTQINATPTPQVRRRINCGASPVGENMLLAPRDFVATALACGPWVFARISPKILTKWEQ